MDQFATQKQWDLDIDTSLWYKWSPTMLEAIEDGTRMHPPYPSFYDLV